MLATIISILKWSASQNSRYAFVNGTIKRFWKDAEKEKKKFQAKKIFRLIIIPIAFRKAARHYSHFDIEGEFPWKYRFFKNYRKQLIILGKWIMALMCTHNLMNLAKLIWLVLCSVILCFNVYPMEKIRISYWDIVYLLLINFKKHNTLKSNSTKKDLNLL